ncbi:MAG: SH3 domain-containing protein [Alphaproteobacteria bacterium]|nr:SH3 domain-containing protein [Alphaproteobacteria bacterium]MBV9418705.1 SH3 domain-containing protein [Alphaproteobacteria bacterium]
MRFAAATALVCYSLAVLPAGAVEIPCNVTANVTDPDPAGLNVRSGPSGKVIGTLQNNGDWIEVHIKGMDGDWYVIDKATQIGANETVLFSGRGYVHKTKVGVSGLQESAVIYTDHDDKSRVLVSSADGDQPTALLACWGDFYQVHIKAGTGWTKTVCNNEFTTCS